MVMPFLQPERQPFPSVKIAVMSARAFAMPFQILRHPGIPTVTADFTGIAVEFLRFQLRPQRTGLDRFAGIVGAEARRFVAPCAVAVNELDKPERRILLAIN